MMNGVKQACIDLQVSLLSTANDSHVPDNRKQLGEGDPVFHQGTWEG